MTARRESPDADAAGRDAVIGGVRAHPADGALCVQDGGRIVVARRDAILQYEGLNAERIEPACDLVAFVILGQAAVSAAGENDHGGLDCRPFRGWIDGETGLIGVLGADGSRSGSGPQQLDFVLRGRLLGEHGDQGQHERQCFHARPGGPDGGATHNRDKQSQFGLCFLHLTFSDCATERATGTPGASRGSLTFSSISVTSGNIALRCIAWELAQAFLNSRQPLPDGPCSVMACGCSTYQGSIRVTGNPLLAAREQDARC